MPRTPFLTWPSARFGPWRFGLNYFATPLATAPDFADKLSHLVNDRPRCICCVQGVGVLPENTHYHDAPLFNEPGGTKIVKEAKKANRDRWLAGALAVAKDKKLVYLDPDNGIGDEAKKYQKAGPKFAYRSDIEAFWKQGQSVVVYHSWGRNSAEKGIRNTYEALGPELTAKDPIFLRLHRGTSPVFCILPQTDTKALIEDKLGRFLHGEKKWRKHFSRVG